MTPAMEQKLQRWWFFLLLVGQLGVVVPPGVAAADCSGPIVFKTDAAAFVEAGFHATMRRRQKHFDYNRIDITWQPFKMVENPACVDRSQLGLEVKAGLGGTWTAVAESPREQGGGKYSWRVEEVTPCHDHYLRLSVGGAAGGRYSLEMPEPVAAAKMEDIAAGGFIPKPPKGLTVTSLGEQSVRVSWTPSDCAQSYDLVYGLTTEEETLYRQLDAADGNSVDITEGLAPCRDYTLTASAGIGEQGYSKEATAFFSTPPGTGAADSLTAAISPHASDVEVVWDTYNTLSCVDKYEVSVCPQGGACLADDVQILTRDNTRPDMTFKKSGLQQCSAFTLNIRPLYADLSLNPKQFDFRTKSPEVGEVVDQLNPITAVKGDRQKVLVSWSPVTCADHYDVFHKTSGGEWVAVGQTKETSLAISAAPCTAYRYGVQVTVDGRPSRIVEVDETIMTSLDTSAPFVVPNLSVTPEPAAVLLAWDHSACIGKYVVSTCTAAAESADKLCERSEVEAPKPEEARITFQVTDLRPCSGYTVEIVPVVEGEVLPAAGSTAFSTASPPAAPPATYTATLNLVRNRVELAWSQVECASGYRILQRMENSDTTTAWETKDGRELVTSFQDPEPCVAYSYGVAAIVDGVVSQPTAYEEVVVPPRQGMSHDPRLTLLESANDSLALNINPAPANIKCQVEKYHVKYTSAREDAKEEHTFEPSGLENGRIVLKFPGSAGYGGQVEGRIKYSGFDSWSPWIKSTGPLVYTSGTDMSNNMLVPIIIGILVAVVVILVVVFFVVKRRRNQSKYSSEKAGAASTKEENQKLNENPDV